MCLCVSKKVIWGIAGYVFNKNVIQRHKKEKTMCYYVAMCLKIHSMATKSKPQKPF